MWFSFPQKLGFVDFCKHVGVKGDGGETVLPVGYGMAV